MSFRQVATRKISTRPWVSHLALVRAGSPIGSAEEPREIASELGNNRGVLSPVAYGAAPARPSFSSANRFAQR